MNSARLVTRGVDGWRHFWFQAVPPHVYAALRITLGLAGCAILLTRTDVAAFWDLSGFVPHDNSRGAALKAWVIANGLGSIAGRVLLAVAAAAFSAMTIGLWSRTMVPLAFVSTLAMQAWNHLPMTGADGALRTFLFCLMWADSGVVWSVDAWRRRHAPVLSTRATSAIAPLRLLRFQVALIYLSAGLYKIDSPLWRNGSAVYYVLNSNVHQRVPYFIAPPLEVISTVLTYMTLLWELGFALLILFPATRRLALIVGVGIHLGMWALMEVGPFHLVMLASYVAFLEPSQVAAIGERLRAYRPVAASDKSVARAGDLIA